MAKTWDIAPRGVSGACCEQCHSPLSIQDARRRAASHVISCPKCGAPSQNGGVKAVLFDDADLLHDEVATLRRVWFHATCSEDWLEEVLEADCGLGDLLVHVGSYDAAVDRAIHCSTKFSDVEWHIYEIILDEATHVSPRVLADQEELAPMWSSEAAGYWSPYGATRYVNGYEDPGSISLLVNPNAIVEAMPFYLDPAMEIENRLAA